MRKAPGKSKQLWARQLVALRLLGQLQPEAVERLKPELLQHPSADIRRWFQEKDVQQALDVITADRGGYELVHIPGSKFMMGSAESEEDRYGDEGPLHEVRVKDFYLGRCPVTNEEYGRFLKENLNVSEPEYWAERKFNQPRQPVVGVSWEDAQRYAAWAEMRLPNEAEWEYACRVGTDTRYYTGDKEKDLDRAGWYNKNSGGQLHPVGEKEANAFGLNDIHGNVDEWVEDDWHKDYSNAPDD